MTDHYVLTCSKCGCPTTTTDPTTARCPNHPKAVQDVVATLRGRSERGNMEASTKRGRTALTADPRITRSSSSVTTTQDTFDALLSKAETLGPGEWFGVGHICIGRTKTTGKLRTGCLNLAPHWYRTPDFEVSLRELVDGMCDWTKQGHLAAKFVRDVREVCA